MDRRTLLIGASALAGSGVAAPAVLSQDRYPSRPIKLVIPFPPGGPTDMLGRRYGEKLSAVLGQPVVIDNKAGAGGVLGADLVAKSRPDGYTLLLGSSSTQVTGPLLMPNPPYHPVKDFTLFIIGFVPMVISCNPGLPARTLPEFVALLKANPDKYRYGSSGMGSIGHLGSELFKLKAGNLISLHVPYKGNNAAVQAALSGEVDWLLDTIGTTLGHYHAGKLRYLAVCAEKRTIDRSRAADHRRMRPARRAGLDRQFGRPAGGSASRRREHDRRRHPPDHGRRDAAGRSARPGDRADRRCRPGEIRRLLQRRARTLGPHHQGERREDGMRVFS